MYNGTRLTTDDVQIVWFGTGEGFVADMITTGLLRADVIEAGSITGSKLANDISITTSGDIVVDGGKITMNSASDFTIASGGTVKINASATGESYIYFGNDISISSQGGISANLGQFDSLMVGGENVLTSALGRKVIVSTSQPDGNGIIWLKPNSVSRVFYSVSTGDNRNHRVGSFTTSFELEANSTSETLTGNSLDYTLKIPFYLIDDGPSYTGLVVHATATKDGNTITFPDYTLGTINAWQEKVATLVLSSSLVNLCNNIHDITVSFSVTGVPTSDEQNSRLFIQRQRYIELTCVDPNAGGSVQPCSVYYIP